MDDALPQKALSVRQPWAFLIVNGWKPVENRSRRTNIRGHILIHAALKFDFEGYDAVCASHPEIPMPGIPARWCRWHWQLGGIVGEAEITDCVTEHPSPFFSGPFGYALANARPLPFVPCRGMLGFFRPQPVAHSKR